MVGLRERRRPPRQVRRCRGSSRLIGRGDDGRISARLARLRRRASRPMMRASPPGLEHLVEHVEILMPCDEDRAQREIDVIAVGHVDRRACAHRIDRRAWRRVQASFAQPPAERRDEGNRVGYVRGALQTARQDGQDETTTARAGAALDSKTKDETTKAERNQTNAQEQKGKNKAKNKSTKRAAMWKSNHRRSAVHPVHPVHPVWQLSLYPSHRHDVSRYPAPPRRAPRRRGFRSGTAPA